MLSQARQPYEEAMLVCLRCQRPTRHKFKYGVRERDGRRHVMSIATYYSCDDCGTERVWGRELPHSTMKGAPVIPLVIEESERSAA